MSSVISSLRESFDSLPNWARYATAGIAVVAVPLVKIYLFSGKRTDLVKKDFKPGMVYLYQWAKPNYLPNLSPFCLKLETWLRMANIPYENTYVKFTDNIRSKEGMLPFVELDGKEYADSSFIIRDLIKIKGKEDLESHLTPEQRGASRAFEQMLEGSTLSSYAFLRYTELIWEMLNEDVIGFELPIIFTIMFKLLGSRRIKDSFKKHNPTCKHAREEVIGIGLEDLRALSEYLGSKQFLNGSKPTHADATLFGVLAQIVYLPLDTPHKQLILTDCTNIKEYCDRIRKRFWEKDWPAAGKQKV